MTTITNPISLLRLDSVKAQTGLARSTIYKMMSEGDFPIPVKITSKAVGWPSNEIDDWITLKMDNRKLLH